MKTDKYSKRQFSLFEHFPIMANAACSFVMLKQLKKHKVMNKQLKERIMLAVTEVNGCTLCSFVHTRVALNSGMSSEEIKVLLAGELDHVPESDVLAVLFAKDFAFNHEVVDKASYARLKEAYGSKKARAILSVAHVITMTNSMGIAMGLLKETLTFKHVKGSNILNEILIPISTMIFFPIFLLGSLFIAPYKVKRLIASQAS